MATGHEERCCVTRHRLMCVVSHHAPDRLPTVNRLGVVSLRVVEPIRPLLHLHLPWTGWCRVSLTSTFPATEPRTLRPATVRWLWRCWCSPVVRGAGAVVALLWRCALCRRLTARSSVPRFNLTGSTPPGWCVHGLWRKRPLIPMRKLNKR